MLRVALLFYKRPRKDLENMGFEINPYDPCVANMMVNGTQCTICLRVNNLKVSHVDEAVVTAFSLKLANLYKGRVKNHRGKVFDYLGMDLDYGSSPRALNVSMIKYLTKVLKEWPEELRGSKINQHSDFYSPSRKVTIGDYYLRNWHHNSIKTWPSYYSYACEHALTYKLQCHLSPQGQSL